MNRDELIAALNDAGLVAVEPYVDDALKTHQSFIDKGKTPWPVEAYVVMEQHRRAAEAGDTKRCDELCRRLWVLQGNTEPYPEITDEDRANIRKAVRRMIAENERRRKNHG